jgi:putative SOS response-associated peptidase YedK
MCERYTLTTVDGLELAPRYNIARGQTAPVLIDGAVQQLRWGQLAPWRGHGGKRGPMIYAIARDQLKPRMQRCEILADGFYAWRALGKKKVPYWIRPEPLRRVSFEGVCATRDDHIASFAIVTVNATPLVSPIAPSIPAVIDDEALAGWRADAVSTWVNDDAHDDAHCIDILGNPNQGELF